MIRPDEGRSHAPEELERAWRDRDAKTLVAAVATWLTAQRRGRALSDHTVRAYTTGIASFLEAIGSKPLGQLARRDIQNWLDTITETSATTTVQVRYAAVKNLLLVLSDHGLVPPNVTRHHRVPRRATAGGPTAVRPYLQEELDALLATADVTEDRVVILLASNLGMKIGEIDRLHWDHIDFERGTIVLEDGRRLLCDEDTLAALRRLRRAGRTPKVLPFGAARARQRFRRVSERAGIAYQGRGLQALTYSAGLRSEFLALDIDLLQAALATTTPRIEQEEDHFP